MGGPFIIAATKVVIVEWQMRESAAKMACMDRSLERLLCPLLNTCFLSYYGSGTESLL